MTDLHRFKELVDRYKKAERFYSDPHQPAKAKDAWRPKMEALVDELAELYCKLLAEGVVGEGDLPPVTEESARMIFNAREVKQCLP